MDAKRSKGRAPLWHAHGEWGEIGAVALTVIGLAMLAGLLRPWQGVALRALKRMSFFTQSADLYHASGALGETQVRLP